MKYRYRISFIIESWKGKAFIHNQLLRLLSFLNTNTPLVWIKLETERTEVTEEIEIEPEIKEKASS